MEKKSEMKMLIEELRTTAGSINSLADWVAELFGIGEAAPEPTDAPAEPTLTLEEVRAILAEKSRNGHTAEVRELLRKYGAAKLSEVDPEHYGALVKDAEVLEDAT